MIRVLLVDDHAVVTEGLTVLLAGIEDLDVVGAAGGGVAAVQRYGELRPDVVLMDLSMPDVDGVEATRRIMELDPEARILALTAFVDDHLVADALAAGAHGYLLKNASGAELHDAIQTVANGRSILSDEALHHLTATRQPRVGYDLTPREHDVLTFLVRGLSNKQIARKMEIREQTVKNHVGHLMEKLGVASRLEAGLLVDAQHVQRAIGYGRGNMPIGFHLGVVPYPPQEAVGNARGATGAPGDFGRPLRINTDVQDAGIELRRLRSS